MVVWNMSLIRKDGKFGGESIKTKVIRTEQHQINKNNPVYKIVDDFCFRSKNLYNVANYIIRQKLFDTGEWIKYRELDKMLQKTDEYKKLMSQASQCTLQVLDRSWKSFFSASRDYEKHPEKYLGKPKIPKYKKKDGRFAWFLKNNQTYVKDGYLHFRLKVFNGYKFKTNELGRLLSVRFVPRGSIYTLEIVYEVEIEENVRSPNRICAIDLGVNNLVTMVNNIGLQPIIINGKGLKSINQYYNKQRAKKHSDIIKRHNIYWCKKLDIITRKRNNKVKNFIHHVTHYITEYCINNDIDTIVFGINKKWKQECKLGNRVTQNFVFIPYNLLQTQLEYKCQNNNINFITTDENYTSGTSFLDNELPIRENYNKSRRIERGLFKSNNGILINSDVNGAYQIMKKVFPNAFADGIKGCLTPVIINVVKTT